MIKKNWEIFLIAILIVIIGGQFPGIYWSFVDDGEFLEVSEKISHAFESGNISSIISSFNDPAVGRFRPAYWLYHWVAYLIGGTDHIWHGLIHLSLFMIMGLGLYKIVHLFTNSRRASFLVSIFFIANAINRENWYRLGPQEPPMVALITISLLLFGLWFKRQESVETILVSLPNKLNISKILNTINLVGLGMKIPYHKLSSSRTFYVMFMVVSVFLYLMKETAIVFVSFYLVAYLLSFFMSAKVAQGYRPVAFRLLLINIVLAFFVRLMASSQYVPGSYASEYDLNWDNIIRSFNSYYYELKISFEPLLSLAIISFIVQQLYLYKNHLPWDSRQILKILAVTTGAAFFLIQLPWHYTIPRYLLPTMYFFAIFLGLQLDDLIRFFENSLKGKGSLAIDLSGTRYIFIAVLWGLIGLVVWYNLATMFIYINRITSSSRYFNKVLTENLATMARPTGTIFFNTQPGTAVELKQETKLHLKLFYNRDDVTVKYLDPHQLDQLQPGDVVLGAGEFKEYPLSLFEEKVDLESKKHVDIFVDDTLYYPPMQMLKVFPRRWVWNHLSKMPYDMNPVLDYRQSHYYWDFYQVK